MNKNITKNKIVTDHLIHGADYNPDQWLDYPEILNEDVRLMKIAGMNEVSIAIFAWKALEPEEGVYNFGWLDELFDRLEANGIDAFLATPSGARPAWMDKNHPECLRVEANRVKNLHGLRHNHCYTAPYYREKVRQMNTMLAERYKDRKALKLWHISNEYGGECHCELCQEAFRDFLRKKYNNDIKLLNDQWWTRFWSHEYSSFDEIESPAPHGETCIHGLILDWRRFVTYQTNEFMKNEIEPLKRITPNIPVATNMMGTFPGLNYWKMADDVDIISWDNYPAWHNDWESEADTAANIAFTHDINRSLKKQPFLLMESTPSNVNWMNVNKLKRPGMHGLSSIQAVAHGADSVQYFQWRKGRGSSEKLHGAVVDHCGHENTRVFKEVAALGADLKKLGGIVGTCVKPEVAVIFDWDNRWAIDELQGMNRDRSYEGTCKNHYKSFWKMGIPVDVNDEEQDFTEYKLVIAPMMYMSKAGVADRLKTFVSNGGTVVFTYATGWVNENDLCYLGGFPGDGLMELTGVWAEELDPLYPTDKNSITTTEGTKYQCFSMCEIIHPNSDNVKVLASYDDDFYKGMPAVTENTYGKGKCYYIAARTENQFMDDFYGKLAAELDLEKPMIEAPVDGVSVETRYGDGEEYYFIMNFNNEEKSIKLTCSATDVLSGEKVSSDIALKPFGYRILKIEG